MPAVLEIGLDPKVVDPTDPALPPGSTPEAIAKGIQDGLEDMRRRGWEAEHLPIQLDAGSAERAVAERLREKSFNVIVIGAGVRLPPHNLELFERVVNAVHKGAPKAALAFNSTPVDTGDAAQRWLGGRSAR